MELFHYVLQFLKNPRIDIRSEEAISQQLKEILLIFICTFTLVIVVVAPLMYVVLDLENIPNKLEEVSDMFTDLQFFLLGVVAAPLGEELLFRFPLKYRKGVLFILAAAVSAIVYLLASKFLLDQQAMVLGALMFFMYGLLIITNDFPWSEEKLRKVFPYVFYLTAALFGFAHVSNYSIDASMWYMTPLLVMPQLLLGLMLGFVRLRYGLWAAILMHAMNNFIPFMAMLFGPDM